MLRLLRHLELVMVSIGGLFFLTACSVEYISSRRTIDAQASLDVFKTHVHPVFKGRGCAGCHTSAGQAKGHEFADEDIKKAHEKAKHPDYVDFSDIENSPLVIEAKNPKHKHGCDKAAGECDENAKQLIAALTKWQQSNDNAAEKNLRYTDAKDADQGKTGDYTDHKLQFSLNKLLNNNDAGNVTLEVMASKTSASDLLTLNNFKLTTTDKSIFLGGLVAKRNNMPNSDRSFMRVCTFAKPLSETNARDFSNIKFRFSLANGDSSPNNISFGLKDLRIAKDDNKCGEESTTKQVDLTQAKADFSGNGVGRIISTYCSRNCHHPNAIIEDDNNLKDFNVFYHLRGEAKKRIKCINLRREQCMPPSGAYGSVPIPDKDKQLLLEWLEALPE